MQTAVESPYLVPFDGRFSIRDVSTAPPASAPGKRELRARRFNVRPQNARPVHRCDDRVICRRPVLRAGRQADRKRDGNRRRKCPEFHGFILISSARGAPCVAAIVAGISAQPQ